MKKMIAVALAAVLALSLTACGTKGGEVTSTFSADLTAFYDTLFQGDDAPMMMAIEDDETLEYLYPGLTAIERTQTVVYTAAISAVAAEAAMVEVTNADDVEAVQAIFQARIDAQVDGGAWYPETMENWENNSKIVTEGNYVCLFVGDDVENMAASFSALGQ
jgi:hypothetical protein